MTLAKPPDQYDATWERLLRLYKQRNQLLRKLGKMASFTGDFTPADAIFMEFDYEWAQATMAKIQALDPKINAAVEELNRHARQAGRPAIDRKKLPTDIL